MARDVVVGTPAAHEVAATEHPISLVVAVTEVAELRAA